MSRRNSKRQQSRNSKGRKPDHKLDAATEETTETIESSGAKDYTPRTIMTKNGFKAGVGNPAYN